MFLKTVTFVSN